MGNIPSLSSDHLDDLHSAPQLKILLDFNKSVNNEVKQLMHWSLEEIRNIYAPFRKRKSSPLLTRSQFLRFLRLSRISAFHIYDCLSQKEQINVFQVMSILILAAYTSYTYKIQFLFIVFDLFSQRVLKFSDLILMFKSVVRGFALLTQQPLPDVQLLQKYAQTMFMKADLNNDQNLQLSEILAWIDQNKDAGELFKAFEPKSCGKEEYHIFNSFTPYTQDQVEILLARIRKIHNHQKIEPEDYHLLKIVEMKSSTKSNKENSSSIMNHSLDLPKLKMKQSKSKQTSSFMGKVSKMEMTKNFKPLNQKSNLIKLPLCQTANTSEGFNGSSKQGGKFSNIIIIKGRTITKRDIFDLRDYFEQLSGGKETILIQDFIESFSQEKYNHMKSVAASLYNFLDHDQNGKVNFRELLLKIYPNLAPSHLTTIDRWCEQYTATFNIKGRARPNRRQDDSKKRVLPKACLARFKEMFSFYDNDRKGYIVLQDMQKVLGEVCSQNQILQLFQDSDKNHDGKISLQQFANVILPSDLQIEGLQ